MVERLAFNFGDGGRNLRRTVDRVTRPVSSTLSQVTSSYLPPIDVPNLGFWGVFAFTALLFFRPQDTFPALAPLHLPECVAIAALIAMVMHRLNHGLPLLRLSPETLAVGFMALVMLATAPFSVWPGGALQTFTDVYVKVVLVFLLMVNSVRSVKALRRLTWLILCAMGYVAARGVLDYASGVNLVKGERLHGSISGLMGNPNDLAMNMITFLPLAVGIAITRGRPLPRIVASIIGVLMTATILFTKSRAGLLGLGAVLLVLIIEGRKLRPGLGVVALVGILAATPFMPSWFWMRLGSITDQTQDESGSRQARKDLMWEGWQTFVDHPMTGVGAGQFKNYNPPDRLEPWRETHNVMLQVSAELGIFGLLALLVLLWQAVRTLLWSRRVFVTGARRRRRSAREPDMIPVDVIFRPDERAWLRMHSVAMSASLVGWIVCAQFASVGYYWTFYYLFALIVAGRELTNDRMFDAAQIVTPPVRDLARQELAPA